MEPRCDINANALCKLSLNKGTYIIDCIHANQIDRISLDYNIDEEDAEYLLRFSLKDIYQARIKEYCELHGSPFITNNLKCVQKSTTKLYGIIDDEYNEVIPFQYNGICFCGNYVCVSINDKCGIIDLKNNVIIPIMYDAIDIRYSCNEIFFVKRATGWGVKSTNGYEIPCIYHTLIECNTQNQIYAKDQNGHFGIIDLNKNIIVPFDYSEIEFDGLFHDNNCCIVKSTNGLFGVIDIKTGNYIIPCRYTFLQTKDGKYCVRYNEEWGILTSRGERIIKIARYDNNEETYFEEDYMIPAKYDWCERDYIDEKGCQTIIVEVNKKYGLIDIVDKTEILPCIYDAIYYGDTDNNLLCCLDGIWGEIRQDGKFTTPPHYLNKEPIGNNRYKVSVAYTLYGIVDEMGNEICSPQYEYIGDFLDGYAFAKKKDKWGLIDNNGTDVIPFQYDDCGGVISNGLIAIKKQEKWGYINIQGKIILPFKYDHACAFENNGFAEVTIYGVKRLIDSFGHFIVRKNNSDVWLKVKGDYDIIYDFHDNWALARKNSLWGLINDQGKTIIPFEYEEAFFSDDDLVRCKKNGFWGFIDNQGKVIIPFIYEYAREFCEDLSACKKNGLWGFIDKCGNNVIPFKFEWAGSFCNHYAKIKEKEIQSTYFEQTVITSDNILAGYDQVNYDYEVYGFINKQGQIIIPPQYERVSDFSGDGIATVYSNDLYDENYPYFINTNNVKITMSK